MQMAAKGGAPKTTVTMYCLLTVILKLSVCVSFCAYKLDDDKRLFLCDKTIFDTLYRVLNAPVLHFLKCQTLSFDLGAIRVKCKTLSFDLGAIRVNSLLSLWIGSGILI